MRPKSIATVVVDLSSTPQVRSTCALGALRSSSVRSGRISVTEPTRGGLARAEAPRDKDLDGGRRRRLARVPIRACVGHPPPPSGAAGPSAGPAAGYEPR